jgi:Ser/Thr protein kinase RdoA (MazF antagonist)
MHGLMRDTSASTEHIPEAVLSHWSVLTGSQASRVHEGLINQTFFVNRWDGGTAVVQRLHPIFDASINLNIAAVTRHLAQKGLLTPRLIPTDEGDLWVETSDGVWRALTFVNGHTHRKVRDPNTAHEAGLLVGRFHRALADFEHDYLSRRGNIHDTSAHLAGLRKALDVHRTHPLWPEVLRVGEVLLEAAETLTNLSSLPPRHAHGDLKISNLLFDDAGRGMCLIDLDTLACMRWPFEMGDALRSWCNPHKEDQHRSHLELGLFKAALAGYTEATRDLISREEWEALVPGLAQICLELSARFLADALNESYFGWDPSRYSTRGEHNLARGRAMWALYQSVERQRGQAERMVELLISSPSMHGT